MSNRRWKIVFAIILAAMVLVWIFGTRPASHEVMEPAPVPSGSVGFSAEKGKSCRIA